MFILPQNLKNLLVKIAAPAVVALPALSTLAQVSAPSLNVRNDIDSVEGLKTKIVGWANIFVGIIALIAVIMLIYAAFLYVTAGADEKKAEKAKTTIIYVVIGIAVVVLSYTIVRVAISFIGGTSSPPPSLNHIEI